MLRKLMRRRRCGGCLEPMVYVGRHVMCDHCDLGACFNPVCPPCRMTFGAGSAALTELRRTPVPWSLTTWAPPKVEGIQDELRRLE